jgi:hypothetical protein
VRPFGYFRGLEAELASISGAVSVATPKKFRKALPDPEQSPASFDKFDLLQSASARTKSATFSPIMSAVK